ncbi:MAG: sugar phosphate isomerase/epimerase family protein [Bacteroidota bacterium]
MKRRKFMRISGTAFAAVHLAPAYLADRPEENAFPVSGRSAGLSVIRLGGPLFRTYDDPDSWIRVLKGNGYRAAYCPVEPGADTALIKAYEHAAEKNDMVIAEVGAWSNPISPDSGEAAQAVEKCIRGLELAERIGARCCVNISGSRNEKYWAGPHPDNLTPEVFDLVVETTRKIIDAVSPKRTFFVLEAMPWSFPDSTDTYLQLLKAIDRKHFGVHLDPVNMITSPRDYFNNGKLIKDMFTRLGPHIKSCHAKDITLREDNYIPQMDEVRPGLGSLDYPVFLSELARLKDVPLMMEHLQTAEQYRLAASYIRRVGKSVSVSL